ncbi:MAG: pyridoxamine 5'-phosphate oxidase [Bacteroidales bacterium]|nr:pyridoxamine 5'-phosphate oxidase [Bacteroidales bacterium]
MSLLHTDFEKGFLNFEDLNTDPRLQFSAWLDEYMQYTVNDNVATTFSSIDQEGFPSSRIVYLRDYPSNGFVFFTNYKSNKGIEVWRNNKASLLFYWPELERQVRIWGYVEKVDEKLSDEYFKTRPRGSQAGAWISAQSQEIKDRESLEQEHASFLKSAGSEQIARPDFWGGFRLIPCKFEFWQGRANRLHDRFLYLKNGTDWDIKRLAP